MSAQRLINILHLSDFHFGIEPKDGDNNPIQFDMFHETVLTNLRIALRNAKKTTEFDFVVISGDIAWRAKENGYNQFVQWINELLKDIEVDHKSVIMCPGNHDFNRNSINGISKVTHNNQEELNLDHIKNRVAPFEFYQSACKDIGIEPLANSTDCTKYLYGCRHFSNEGVLFAVFNSAWNELDDTKPDDRWLGKGPLQDVEYTVAQIRDIEHNRYPNDELLVISVFHHPIEKMNDSETSTYDRNKPATINRLASFLTAMILNGHTHGKTNEFSFPHTDIAEFNGGTVFSTDSEIFGFEIISINLSEWKCTQHLGICEGTQWYIKYDVKSDYFHYGRHFQRIKEQTNIIDNRYLSPVVTMMLEGFNQEQKTKRKVRKKQNSYQRDTANNEVSSYKQKDRKEYLTGDSRKRE